MSTKIIRPMDPLYAGAVQKLSPTQLQALNTEITKYKDKFEKNKKDKDDAIETLNTYCENLLGLPPLPH